LRSQSPHTSNEKALATAQRRLRENTYLRFVGWKQIAANGLQLQDAAEVLGRVFLQFRTLYPYCRILERLRQARDDRRSRPR